MTGTSKCGQSVASTVTRLTAQDWRLGRGKSGAQNCGEGLRDENRLQCDDELHFTLPSG
jgi:hypothetical protein